MPGIDLEKILIRIRNYLLVLEKRKFPAHENIRSVIIQPPTGCFQQIK